jgi:DNA-binding transcriptional regulator YiaG
MVLYEEPRQDASPKTRSCGRVTSFLASNHGLSQAETVAFFRVHLFDLTLSTLKSWESGRTKPRTNTRELLERFLQQHPNPKGEC